MFKYMAGNIPGGIFWIRVFRGEFAWEEFNGWEFSGWELSGGVFLEHFRSI